MKNLKRFSICSKVLFCLMLLLPTGRISAQTLEYTITMTPVGPNPFDFSFAFSSSDPSCVVCNRVCWKWNGSFCTTEFPSASNLLPIPFLSNTTWYGLCSNNCHVFRIYNNCTNQTLYDSICIEKNWIKSKDVISRCDSYTWPKNGLTYTASGLYTDTIISLSGDTTEAILGLTINYSTSNTTSATACDSYTWAANGSTYTASGTYTATSLNASGCLHTEILNLTINNSTSNTTNASACGSYTWTVNGSTYTASGTYTATSLNASGCIHTEILNLTINCINVPTLSEWGLLLLFLLCISFGMSFIYSKENSLSLANGKMPDSPMPLIDKKLFTRIFLFVSTVEVIACTLVYTLYDDISSTDMIGSLMTSLIVTYIIQLYILMKRFEKNQ